MPDFIYSKNVWWFDEEEIRALYRLLEKEFISYEDEGIRNVVNKISAIVKAFDVQLDRPNSQTT